MNIAANINVIVIGYGSIGRKHIGNLLSMGIRPFVLTAHPDAAAGVRFISSLKEKRKYDYAVIATPTADHLKDFKQLVYKTGCRNVLIEKPIADSLKNAEEIARIARNNNTKISVGYDMRFLKVFELIRKCVKSQLKRTRIVKIQVGQYLPEWRPGRNHKKCYSSHRKKGGGVDLDLSHEIDYMLWLFGFPDKIVYTLREKLSSITVDSPDYFKGLYRYKNFIIDVEMDYMRKLERTLTVLGENSRILDVDFISKSIKVMNKDIRNKQLFDYKNALIDEMREFVGIVPKKHMCGLEAAVDTVRLLQLEN